MEVNFSVPPPFHQRMTLVCGRALVLVVLWSCYTGSVVCCACHLAWRRTDLAKCTAVPRHVAHVDRSPGRSEIVLVGEGMGEHQLLSPAFAMARLVRTSTDRAGSALSLVTSGCRFPWGSQVASTNGAWWRVRENKTYARRLRC